VDMLIATDRLPASPLAERRLAPLVDAARVALGEEDYAVARAYGRSLTLDQFADAALRALDLACESDSPSTARGGV
jgi:hypothetical protein